MTVPFFVDIQSISKNAVNFVVSFFLQKCDPVYIMFVFGGWIDAAHAISSPSMVKHIHYASFFEHLPPITGRARLVILASDKRGSHSPPWPPLPPLPLLRPPSKLPPKEGNERLVCPISPPLLLAAFCEKAGLGPGGADDRL